MTTFSRSSGLILALVSFSMLSNSSSLAADRGIEDAAKLDASIDQLIRKLGDTKFATRERAQGELERLGLVAFDALYEAQQDDDVEIAMRARYLVRSMRVTWATDDDTAEVRRILREYGSQNDQERQNRMDRLASLDAGAGIAALCRLVRFESSMVLSKRAAMLVMQNASPQAESERQEFCKIIRSTVGFSKRPGTIWLKTLADSFERPDETIAAWQELTKQELETYLETPAKSRREIVRDLIRWQVDFLKKIDRHDQAIVALGQSLDLLKGTREEILETVDWLMERDAWPIVQQVAKRFSKQFDEDALLLYRLAEAFAQQGQPMQANDTADKALKLTPDDPDAHVVAAYSLQDRGLFQWAEREYRYVLNLGPTGSMHDLRGRMLLSEMLHDTEQELAAAEVLQGAVDAMEKDPAVKETMENRLGRSAGSIASRMHYFYSRDFAAKGNTSKAIEHLENGVKADPTDADVLIAMFHTEPPDETWRKMVLRRIEAATGNFRDQMEEYDQQLRQAQSEPTRSWATQQLASASNQFAWLVGNTEGDLDAALRGSQRSLELRPDTGGYLDTLGRCYYAKGDLENAIKFQQKAVDLEPHSHQIRRQLEMFKQELAKKNKPN